MISNERPSPYGRRPLRPQRSHYSSSSLQPTYSKPPSEENTLKTERLQVERKTFVISLKENDRGRFLRIVEESNGHRDMIIVPSTGLEEFDKILSAIVQQAGQPPNPENT